MIVNTALQLHNRSCTLLIGLSLCLSFYAYGVPLQAQSAQPAEQKPGQSSQLPDAPSTTQPPSATAAPSTAAPSSPATEEPQPKPATPPPPPANDAPTSPPPSNVTTVPPGTAPRTPGSSRDQLFTLTKSVNFVVLPVTVKDEAGHLVPGLVQRDFSVYEDGVKQTIRLFTSDPFPLSAAVIVDTGMSDTALRKVNQTFAALQGAFSSFDELALYTYSNTVRKATDFTAINPRLDGVLQQIKQERGATGGVPVVGGPINSGPTINGLPADQSRGVANTPTRTSHVLNDAILAAALDLGKRDPTRRKLVFIISDGQELGSTASYNDVLKVLLSRNIAVYAVAVDAAAIPGVRTVEKIHLPRFGTSNILPKYVSATAGQLFPEFSRPAIESAYAELTREARNQYTIGYMTRATPSSSYRTVDVRIDQAGLKVYAKDGYYPLPPGR